MKVVVDWFAMGGYSMYVWPAYALVGSVLIGNVMMMKRYSADINHKLSQWFKRS
jgi:heme exporter protein D